MSRPREKRFSIDDAFEEEEADAQVAQPPAARPSALPFYKCAEDAASKDSESLIHDPSSSSPTSQHRYHGHPYRQQQQQQREQYSSSEAGRYWWRHPKVRENWRTVVGAALLLVVGAGLLATACVWLASGDGVMGAVFLVVGLMCFVPGAYHVVYVWLAARGRRGYDFYHLPLFT